MVKLTLEQAYYNNIVKGLNTQLSQTINWLGSEEAQIFFNKRSQNIHTFWKNSKMREEWDNLTRSNAENSKEYIEQIYETGAKHGYNQISRLVGYTVADRETLYHLKQYNYNLIKRVNKDTIQNIRTILTRAEAEGLHPFETARLLRDSGLDGINKLSPLQRARMIARTESRRASTAGTIQAYTNYGIQEGIIITAGDENVCDECLDKESKNPYPLKELAGLVPVHPNCYHQETKLYTQDGGWKPIKDITTNDKVLTVNPETKEPVFQHPIATIKKKASELVHIHNKWFETCITNDHDCFIYQRQGRDRKLVPEFRKPDGLNSESRFLRTCCNNNVSPDTVDVNGLELSIDDFIFLTAWFLSEGSVLHDDALSKKHGHPVKISQEKHHSFLVDKLKQFTNKYNIRLGMGKKYFELYDKRLRDYFLQFGYTHEKYVPRVLFDCSREDIKQFLEYYIMSDGSEREPNKLNSIEKTIYTSSEKMMNDLSYLILLAGYYPSIALHSHAGKVVKHHNGVYTQNHNMYCIRLNKSEYTYYDSCSSDTITYDDYVYCVEVPEYHTLWTLYEGKTTWNGNCRCTVGAVLDNVNRVLDEDAPAVINKPITNGG